MNNYPEKVIELYLRDGTINGTIEVEVANWNGKAIKMPRTKFKEFGKTSLNKSGIYFLICEDEDTNEEAIYIGESGDIYNRNNNRLSNPNSNDYYDWKTIIAFTRKNLDRGKRTYAENKIRTLAEECNRYEILTSKTSNELLKESYQAEMNEFIGYVKTILNILGYKLLEPTVENKDEELLWEIIRDKEGEEHIHAKAYYNEETREMVLLKGSNISSTLKNVYPKIMTMREEKREKGIIDKNNTLTEDIICKSPSEATNFVLGYRGGPYFWKNSKINMNLRDYRNNLENNND